MRREQNFKLTGNRTGAHLWYRCSTWRRSIVLDENSHISEHFGEQHMSHLHISLRQSTFTAAESGIPMIEYYNFTSIEAAKGFKFVIRLASTSAAGDSVRVVLRSFCLSGTLSWQVPRLHTSMAFLSAQLPGASYKTMDHRANREKTRLLCCRALSQPFHTKLKICNEATTPSRIGKYVLPK